jgi:WD40 repeat protein
MKIRNYEKEEKRETKRTQMIIAEIESANRSDTGYFTPRTIERAKDTESINTAEGNRRRSISGNDDAFTIAESVSSKSTATGGSYSPTPSTPSSITPFTPTGSNLAAANIANLTAATTLHLGASITHRYQPPLQEEHITARNFAFIADAKVVLSCGHWDRSVRVTSIETGRLVQSLRQHRDVVSCLAVARDFGQRWLITGSRDCTLIVWDVVVDRGSFISAIPTRTLHGHDDVVTCVFVNPEINSIFSGSEDGTIIIHNLREGDYVRTIINRAIDMIPPGFGTANLPSNKSGKNGGRNSDSFSDDGSISSIPQRRRSRSTISSVIDEDTERKTLASFRSSHPLKVTWLGYSKEGYIIVYSAEYGRLTTFSLNGTFICSRKVPETLYALLLSGDGKVLVSGGSACVVTFRWVSTHYRTKVFLYK